MPGGGRIDRRGRSPQTTPRQLQLGRLSVQRRKLREESGGLPHQHPLSSSLQALLQRLLRDVEGQLSRFAALLPRRRRLLAPRCPHPVPPSRLRRVLPPQPLQPGRRGGTESHVPPLSRGSSLPLRLRRVCRLVELLPHSLSLLPRAHRKWRPALSRRLLHHQSASLSRGQPLSRAGSTLVHRGPLQRPVRSVARKVSESGGMSFGASVQVHGRTLRPLRNRLWRRLHGQRLRSHHTLQVHRRQLRRVSDRVHAAERMSASHSLSHSHGTLRGRPFKGPILRREHQSGELSCGQASPLRRRYPSFLSLI